MRCIVCKTLLIKEVHRSTKQFEQRKYCSRKCSNRYKAMQNKKIKIVNTAKSYTDYLEKWKKSSLYC